MKKTKTLTLLFLLTIACSTQESTQEEQEIEQIENNEQIEIDTSISWTKGIGKSPEEFISNWNKLINSI